MSDPIPGRAVPLSARQLARLDVLRRWSRLLDSAFRLPGTRIRFGWDPIVGLVPGLGELVTPLFSILLLAQAFSVKIPKLVQLRMLVNVALDEAAGLVPGVGDLLDVAWKANTRNLELLDRHARRGIQAGVIDRLFGAVVLVLLVTMALVPLLVFAWVIYRFGLF